MGIENWIWIGLAGGGASLLFALFLLWRLLSRPQGDTGAPGLPAALRQGSLAYLKWQLLLSGGGLLLVTLLLTGLSGLSLLEPTVPPLFLSSGLCGLLSGLVGTLVSAAAGPRAVGAAGQRLDRGVYAAFSAGAVTGFFTVGLGLCHLTVWLLLLGQGFDLRLFPLPCAGSALAALLFHMGTLFTRSAEMAAESLDRELGLAPGSPWNPAAIARGVGHGAGGGAVTASLLYCVYENLLFVSLLWGSNAFAAVDMARNAALLPLAVAAAGALLSPVGLLTLGPMERGDRRSLSRRLRLAALVPAVLTAAAALPLTYLLMGSWELCTPILIGLALGLLIPLAGEYFTSGSSAPARSLAETAEPDPAAAVTGALGMGACSSLLPLLLTAGGMAAAFWSAGGGPEPSRGLYGAALAGVGMLSSLGMTLAAAESGPIGECAAYTASLSGEENPSPHPADSLAAIGAPAASGGKCLAAAAVGLTGLLLLAHPALPGEEPVRLGLPLLLGMAAGAMTVLLFSGLLLLGVRGSARSTLALARRQLRGAGKGPGSSEPPDHAACVRRCSLRSLLRFLPPLALVLASPPAVGVLLRTQGLLGFSGSVLLLSVAACLLLLLSGGILDGARRYVESGRRGGEGGDCHRALLTAESTLAPLTRAAGAALPALAMASVTLSLLCLPLLELIPPIWG